MYDTHLFKLELYLTERSKENLIITFGELLNDYEPLGRNQALKENPIKAEIYNDVYKKLTGNNHINYAKFHTEFCQKRLNTILIKMENIKEILNKESNEFFNDSYKSLNDEGNLIISYLYEDKVNEREQSRDELDNTVSLIIKKS